MIGPLVCSAIAYIIFGNPVKTAVEHSFLILRKLLPPKNANVSQAVISGNTEISFCLVKHITTNRG